MPKEQVKAETMKHEVPEKSPNQKNDMLKIRQKLGSYKEIIEKTNAYKECIDKIPSVKTLRCLALGSPSDSNIAMYQLAFLVLLQEKFKFEVSAYDPIFNDNDNELFSYLKITVEEDFEAEMETTLYYLPHAPLDLTETIIKTEIKYMLGNNIAKHTERLTKSKLHQQYPTLSHLVNLTTQETKDEFITVSRRKKYVPPKIEYDYSTTYFKSLQLTEFDNDGPLNCFSDMTLHVIE
ncbi:SRR1-like protein Ber1p [[Candida] jaroonii]|uniref:SRR1-like protein Ber1p n=1 Tax=[Candida] jaroonii TaxID=467808 RepID=A0ACA9YAV1_9ASCO|nr:SRR1-like protein Ber1p [[Candida] jaroonii]